jgi:hypothetical protein
MERRHFEDQDGERDETQQLQNKLLAAGRAGSALDPCDVVISPVSPNPSVATASIATAAYASNRLWAKVSPKNVEKNVELRSS